MKIEVTSGPQVRTHIVLDFRKTGTYPTGIRCTKNLNNISERTIILFEKIMVILPKDQKNSKLNNLESYEKFPFYKLSLIKKLEIKSKHNESEVSQNKFKFLDE